MLRGQPGDLPQLARCLSTFVDIHRQVQSRRSCGGTPGSRRDGETWLEINDDDDDDSSQALYKPPVCVCYALMFLT